MNAIGLTTTDWSLNFRLLRNLDMSVYTGTQYNIIGNLGTPFTGTFDGNSMNISNLNIAQPGLTYVGLFGYISSPATIMNLNLLTPNITGSTYTGALVGTALASTTLTNINVLGGTVTGNLDVGGLAGLTSGTVSGSTAQQPMTSSASVTGGQSTAA